MKILVNLILYFNIVKFFIISNKVDYYNLNGIYIIKNYNDIYLTIKNNNILLSNIQTHFRLNNVFNNIYYIKTKITNKFLGLNDNNDIILYGKKENINKKKIFWSLFNIHNNQFCIKNNYNNLFIESNNNYIKCQNKLTRLNFNNYSQFLTNKSFIFTLLRISKDKIGNKTFLNYIKRESIDVLIKYIDLSDNNLNRSGIKQIYKDIDNEELKFSIRSILVNIPWIRKIFILMPNNKVKFLKSINEINDKIIYIKDNDLIGFDCANIFAFSFNLYKMEKFGISKNFIYMEDDFFIGKPLKKYDFFYYDSFTKKVFPYIITKHFHERNKSELINKYNNLYKKIDFIHPHSGEGWWLSIYNTENYFFEKYNKTFITTQFTHNAIPENIDDIKEIFKEIKNYKYIKETLYSKERHIKTLNQPHFYNLYQINIKHKIVNTIPYKYFAIESINKIKITTPLYVLNTGGNHRPLNRHYKLQRKIMEKIFSSYNIYELKFKKKITINKIIKIFVFLLQLFLLFAITKIYLILYNYSLIFIIFI